VIHRLTFLAVEALYERCPPGWRVLASYDGPRTDAAQSRKSEEGRAEAGRRKTEVRRACVVKLGRGRRGRRIQSVRHEGAGIEDESIGRNPQRACREPGGINQEAKKLKQFILAAVALVAVVAGFG